MAFLANAVFDSGLSYITSNGSRIDITSTEATTYAEATSTLTLGNSASLSVGSPADRGAGGREVTAAAISDGSVTGTGTAAFYAITDGTSVLIATGALTASQAVTSGNSFTLSSFTVGIPDPV
jgi:hypothetical protein